MNLPFRARSGPDRILINARDMMESVSVKLGSAYATSTHAARALCSKHACTKGTMQQGHMQQARSQQAYMQQGCMQQAHMQQGCTFTTILLLITTARAFPGPQRWRSVVRKTPWILVQPAAWRRRTPTLSLFLSLSRSLSLSLYIYIYIPVYIIYIYIYYIIYNI